jgi:hypothetical protein
MELIGIIRLMVITTIISINFVRLIPMVHTNLISFKLNMGLFRLIIIVIIIIHRMVS